MYSSTLFLTSALEGGEGSASCPGRTLLPGNTRYPLYRRLGGSQGRSGQVWKISPPPGFDPQTVHPVGSRYTDYATRPTNITYLYIFFPHPVINSMYVLPQTVTADSIYFSIQNKEYDFLMLAHFVCCHAGSVLLFSSTIYMNCIHQHFRNRYCNSAIHHSNLFPLSFRLLHNKHCLPKI